MSDSENNWQSRPLGEMATTTSGGTPSRKRKDYYGGSIPWVKSGELNDDYIFETEEHLTEEGLKNSSAKLFQSGTILIALYGATVGKTSILRTNASTNQAVCGITPGPDLDVGYLRYHLISLRRELLSHRYGGAQPNISQQIVRNQKIAYPPLPEQKKIAHILSTVQRAIEAQERIIQTTTELKKALMHKLFTEGLRYEPQKQTETGLIPASWEIAKISEIADLKSGGTPSRSRPEFWTEGDISWIKTGEVDYCTINNTEEKITKAGLAGSSAKLFPAGTLLIAMYGQGITRGKVAITGIEAATNQACAAIFPSAKVKTKYLYFFLEYNYNAIRNFAHGANQKNLSADLIKSFPLAYPNTNDVQEEIINTLVTIDDKLQLHRAKKIGFLDLFRTLLHELMTAKTRVHEIEIFA
jgi:type I restriction enzyme S subunit